METRSRRAPAPKSTRSKIVFVTGTDTGVGKTLMTGLLLAHLRAAGQKALGIKPFCSGGREDIEFLQQMNGSALTAQEITPYYFNQPVAPLVSQQHSGRQVLIDEVLEAIRKIEQRCDWLIIEGSGGLMVPLGEGFLVRDLIARLDCSVVVVARNLLGTINHTLLTVQALEKTGRPRPKIALMNSPKPDFSSETNATMIQAFLRTSKVFAIPYLGIRATRREKCETAAIFLTKTLADILQ